MIRLRLNRREQLLFLLRSDGGISPANPIQELPDWVRHERHHVPLKSERAAQLSLGFDEHEVLTQPRRHLRNPGGNICVMCPQTA